MAKKRKAKKRKAKKKTRRVASKKRVASKRVKRYKAANENLASAKPYEPYVLKDEDATSD